MRGFPTLAVSFALLLMPTAYSQNVCNELTDIFDSFVCVCDATYCDFPGTITAPTVATDFTRVVSDRDTNRFALVSGSTETTSNGNAIVHVNYDREYQAMHGFGGAFTDSTGLNVLTMSVGAQDNFVRSYFAPEGIEYDVCRIPVAGSDFSTKAYSYDDVDGDTELLNFALTSEDFDYKIPLIQRAIELSSRNILFFGSPWAPPAWMKTNGMANGTGALLDEMWDPFSNYLVKFVEAYESNGIPIWGITPTNEPLVGAQDWAWNACYWNQTDMRDWIVQSFGPIMTNAGLRRVKLMILDHNRDAIPWYPQTILENEEANSYVDGTAVHWYGDDASEPGVLSELQGLFPDKFILYTESCEGWYDNKVNLGDWSRAQNYADDILENVNQFSTGWVDWNMALDMSGGPNWAGNTVDSPIIIDAANDRFLKQPMFYAMGHFSKFIQPGAIRIYNGVGGSNYYAISAGVFNNPDGTTAIVLLNKEDSTQSVSVETKVGTFINIDMTPKSLETILIQTG